MIKEIYLHTKTREDFDAAAEQLTLRGLLFADGDRLTDSDITIDRGNGPEFHASYYDLFEGDTLIGVENVEETGVTKLMIGSAEQAQLASLLAALSGKEGLNVVRFKAGDDLPLEGEVHPIDPTKKDELTYYYFNTHDDLKEILEKADAAGYKWHAGQEPLELYDEIIEDGMIDVIVVVEESQQLGKKKLAVSRAIEVVDHGDGAQLETYTGQAIE